MGRRSAPAGPPAPPERPPSRSKNLKLIWEQLGNKTPVLMAINGGPTPTKAIESSSSWRKRVGVETTICHGCPSCPFEAIFKRRKWLQHLLRASARNWAFFAMWFTVLASVIDESSPRQFTPARTSRRFYRSGLRIPPATAEASYTMLPPTTVCRTWTFVISSAGTSSGLRSSTIMSANLPTSIDPVALSS
jgi:hypothetical protein